MHELQDIYTAVQRLPDLAPGPQINTLLSRLVEVCIQPYSDDFTISVLNNKGVDSLCLELRSLCATAESELERHWAQRILESAWHAGARGTVLVSFSDRVY